MDAQQLADALDLVEITIDIRRTLFGGSEALEHPATWFGQAHMIDRFTARLPAVEPHVLRGCGRSLHDDCPDRTYDLLLPFLTGG